MGQVGQTLLVSTEEEEEEGCCSGCSAGYSSERRARFRDSLAISVPKVTTCLSRSLLAAAFDSMLANRFWISRCFRAISAGEGNLAGKSVFFCGLA